MIWNHVVLLSLRAVSCLEQKKEAAIAEPGTLAQMKQY